MANIVLIIAGLFHLFRVFICAVGLALGACQSHQVDSTPTQKKQAYSNIVTEPRSEINYAQYKMRKNLKKPIVALVLGSGGARGYAHIGVIEVLEKNGIKPDFIVGTSAGSIVGSLYASGKSARELKQTALNLQVNDVREFNIGLQGFFDGSRVEKFVNQQVAEKPLEALSIPMYVVATELKQGDKVVFNKGNTGQAVRASISIPSMFIPASFGGREYVDGGLVSPVPVKVAHDLGADVIIAVDILAQPVHTETTNVWGMFNQNINIMQNKLAHEELKYADVVIKPDIREKVHIFDVKGRELTMQTGVEAALEKINQIEYLVHTYTPVKSGPYAVKKIQED